jgi:hypothetical protein
VQQIARTVDAAVFKALSTREGYDDVSGGY